MATNFEKKPGQPFGNKVIVQYDNVEKAMRKLKKKVNESGILQTLRQKEFFEKPQNASASMPPQFVDGKNN